MDLIRRRRSQPAALCLRGMILSSHSLCLLSLCDLILWAAGAVSNSRLMLKNNPMIDYRWFNAAWICFKASSNAVRVKWPWTKTTLIKYDKIWAIKCVIAIKSSSNPGTFFWQTMLIIFTIYCGVVRLIYKVLGIEKDYWVLCWWLKTYYG